LKPPTPSFRANNAFKALATFSEMLQTDSTPKAQRREKVLQEEARADYLIDFVEEY
jgi:hypothetical protein